MKTRLQNQKSLAIMLLPILLIFIFALSSCEKKSEINENAKREQFKKDSLEKIRIAQIKKDSLIKDLKLWQASSINKLDSLNNNLIEYNRQIIRIVGKKIDSTYTRGRNFIEATKSFFGVDLLFEDKRYSEVIDGVQNKLKNKKSPRFIINKKFSTTIKNIRNEYFTLLKKHQIDTNKKIMNFDTNQIHFNEVSIFQIDSTFNLINLILSYSESEITSKALTDLITSYFEKHKDKIKRILKNKFLKQFEKQGSKLAERKAEKAAEKAAKKFVKIIGKSIASIIMIGITGLEELNKQKEDKTELISYFKNAYKQHFEISKSIIIVLKDNFNTLDFNNMTKNLLKL